MSKKRKTRREKIVSQERHKHLITQSSPSDAMYSFVSSEPRSKIKNPPASQNGQNHAYVLQDLKRSMITTSLLIFISITLFILIKTQVINLTNLGY